jgi:hypothetical protein
MAKSPVPNILADREDAVPPVPLAELRRPSLCPPCLRGETKDLRVPAILADRGDAVPPREPSWVGHGPLVLGGFSQPMITCDPVPDLCGLLISVVLMK